MTHAQRTRSITGPTRRPRVSMWIAIPVWLVGCEAGIALVMLAREVGWLR